MKHYSTVIGVTSSIVEGESQGTSIEFSHETSIKSISIFSKQAKSIIAKARKRASEGAYVFVDVTKATYSIEHDEQGRSIIDTLTTEKFEMWSGYGDQICAEGCHLTPSKQYNEDQTKDLWLTGKNILEELNI